MPQLLVKGDLVPRGPPSLTITDRCQNEEPPQELHGLAGAAVLNGLDRLSDLSIVQGSVVLLHGWHGREGPADCVSGEILVDVAVRDHPIQDNAEPLPELASILVLRCPDGRQRPEHVVSPNSVDCIFAERGHRVPFNQL